MAIVDGLRQLVASIDIGIANLISKVYQLIVMLADVNVMSKIGDEIFDKIFSLIAVFMLFKMAIIIIQYIINPDELTSSKKSGIKFLKNIVISLFMLTIATTVFEKMFQLQSIILRENLLGKLIIGDENKNLNDESNDFYSLGNEISYYVFSSFMDYNRKDIFEEVFPEDCPNIFVEEDYSLKTSFKEIYFGIKNYQYYQCASYITHGLNTKYNDSTEYDVLDDSRFDYVTDLETNEKIDVGWSKNVLQNSPFFDQGGYYTCKSYLLRSPNCGIKNGVYIFYLINKARKSYDVSLMLSDEILNATESDHFFLSGSEIYNANGSVDGNDSCYCNSCDGSNNKDAEFCKDTNGGYIFEYKFFISTLVGLLILFMIIILAIDTAVRSIKLCFLQIISPIPIVSFMDIKENDLFKKWLKLFINSYLELFLKLGSIFLSFLLIKMLMSSEFDNIFALRNTWGRFLFIIGCLFFAKEAPDFVGKLLNIGGDTGIGTFLKNAVKFITGVGTMALAGTGGAISNLSSGIEKISETKGTKNKMAQFGKTILSTLGGAGSASARALGNHIKSGGNANLNNVIRGIYGSSYARYQNENGQHIGKRTLDKFKNMAQINNSNLSSNDIQNRINHVKDLINNNKTMIDNMLYGRSDASMIRDAFALNDEDNRIYADYDDYQSNVQNGIDSDTYNLFSGFYDKRDQYNKELEMLENQYEHEKTIEGYNKK